MEGGAGGKEGEDGKGRSMDKVAKRHQGEGFSEIISSKFSLSGSVCVSAEDGRHRGML